MPRSNKPVKLFPILDYEKALLLLAYDCRRRCIRRCRRLEYFIAGRKERHACCYAAKRGSGLTTLLRREPISLRIRPSSIRKSYSNLPRMISQGRREYRGGSGDGTERQNDPFFEFFGIASAGPARPFDTGASGRRVSGVCYFRRRLHRDQQPCGGRLRLRAGVFQFERPGSDVIRQH